MYFFFHYDKSNLLPIQPKAFHFHNPDQWFYPLDLLMDWYTANWKKKNKQNLKFYFRNKGIKYYLLTFKTFKYGKITENNH